MPELCRFAPARDQHRLEGVLGFAASADDAWTILLQLVEVPRVDPRAREVDLVVAKLAILALPRVRARVENIPDAERACGKVLFRVDHIHRARHVAHHPLIDHVLQLREAWVATVSKMP